MNAKDKFILGFCRLGIAGLSPKAPGTCGTALALVFAPFLFLPFGLTGRVIFLLLLFVAGSLAASRGEILLAQRYEINAGYPMPRATVMAGINLNF